MIIAEIILITGDCILQSSTATNKPTHRFIQWKVYSDWQFFLAGKFSQQNVPALLRGPYLPYYEINCFRY